MRLISHGDESNRGINPGAKWSPYSTDYGAWMDCPFWVNNNDVAITGGSSVNVYITKFTNAAKSMHPGAYSATEIGKICVRGCMLIYSPVSIANTVGETTFLQDSSLVFDNSVGRFNQLRTNVMNGNSVGSTDKLYNMNVSEYYYAGGTEFNNLNFHYNSGDSYFTLPAAISGDSSGAPNDWGELGCGQPGALLIVAKSFREGDVAFPDDRYGIYKVKKLGSSDARLYIDTSYKAMPSDIYEGVTVSCTCQSGTWAINHVGYNSMESPWILMESLTGNGGDDGSIDVLTDNPYMWKACFRRNDAVTTMYMPFDGNKGMTYQSLTGRAASHRIRDVKFKAATVVSGIAVIGNIDTEDDKKQRFREKNRIMWSSQGALDAFGLFKFRDVGINDSDEIVALESIQGKLLVIKESNTYVLNPNANFQQEGVIYGGGLKWTNCRFSTPLGVVVANDKQITLLPNNLELTQAIRNTYQSLTFHHPIIGYSGKYNEIVFMPDTSESGTTMFIYNFDNKSWIKRTYTSGNKYSNFQYGDNGELLFVKITESLGSEKTQNPDCSSTTGWTFTDWTHNADEFTHNTGNTTALSNTATGGNLDANSKYRVEVVILDMSAGSFTVRTGAGAESGVVSTTTGNNTYSFDLVTGSSTSSEAIKITPADPFDGSVTRVSVKKISETYSVMKYKGSASGTNDDTSAVFKTKDFVFGEPHARKYVSQMAITYKSAVDVSVKIFVNGRHHSDKKLTSNTVVKTRKMRINAECQSISFQFTSDNTGGTDDAFILEDLIIEGWYNDKD